MGIFEMVFARLVEVAVKLTQGRRLPRLIDTVR